MRLMAPFSQHDLYELDANLLGRAASVVAMQDVAEGQRGRSVIGMRHDVDNEIEPAVAFARWEAERGYRSTYYILHTAPYWRDKDLLVRSCSEISECGHEIGIHNNALSEAFMTGRDPRLILAEALEELRGYGFDIRSTAAHGDPLCYDDEGKVRFVNDEMFEECQRPEFGEPERTIGNLRIKPIPLWSLGLEFDAAWLDRDAYLSDSGGVWRYPGFEKTAERFPFRGQLHMLVHPDWWGKAFVAQRLAA